jgi:hypothetical protein
VSRLTEIEHAMVTTFCRYRISPCLGAISIISISAGFLGVYIDRTDLVNRHSTQPTAASMQLPSSVPISLSAVLFSASIMASLGNHMPRQIDAISIGDACFDIVLKGRELSAFCLANGGPMSTSLDLNQCLTNDHGVMRFDLRYELVCRVYLCCSTFLTS